MLRGESESATGGHANHRGKNPSWDADGDKSRVIFRDGRGFHPDIEFLSEVHSASLEPSAVRTGHADAKGVVTNASQRWMTSIAPAAAHAGAASAHRGWTPCGSRSDPLGSAPVVRRRLEWRAPVACRAGGRLGVGRLRRICASAETPANTAAYFRKDGGYGWDRTTDLTIMSRALSPAELRSPKGANLTERRGAGATHGPTDEPARPLSAAVHR